MSHYAVAVFTEEGGKTVEELLNPYYEDLCVPTITTKKEIIDKARKEIEEYKNGLYAEYLKDPEGYISACTNEKHIKYITEEFPEKLKWTDEECYRDKIKYEDEEDILDNGDVLSVYNPNSKWDWYVVGGRFSNIVPLKNGEFADEADMCDVDIDYVDKVVYDKMIKFWEIYVDGREPESEEEKKLVEYEFYLKDYYNERYKDAKDLAEHRASFTFYSALLPNYLWREAGQMGWWGMSNATTDDEIKWRKEVKDILKKAKENNWHITIVDCHI